jgi:alpha-tubulin suppressor-like RCC1 family protein
MFSGVAHAQLSGAYYWGDLNGNGIIDFPDYNGLAGVITNPATNDTTTYKAYPHSRYRQDLNGNGIMDFPDFNQLGGWVSGNYSNLAGNPDRLILDGNSLSLTVSTAPGDSVVVGAYALSPDTRGGALRTGLGVIFKIDSSGSCTTAELYGYNPVSGGTEDAWRSSSAFHYTDKPQAPYNGRVTIKIRPTGCVAGQVIKVQVYIPDDDESKASGHRFPSKLSAGSLIIINVKQPILITAGDNHSCARVSGGGLKCWGANDTGQLGDGSTANSNTPVTVYGFSSNGLLVDGGDFHTCAINYSYGLKCWGFNYFGQLGDGTTVNRSQPVDVSGLSSGVTVISAGFSHSCALTSTGGVKCWGDNSFGQLGDGTYLSSPVPVDVSGLTAGVMAVAAGDFHSCAITTTGAVKCWGFNGDGELGDGTWDDSSVPVDVYGLSSNAVQISAGWSHTCVVMKGGGVKCWGVNLYGQLGDGTTVTSNVPVDVSGISQAALVAAGGMHSCLLLTGGGLKCWGDNGVGQLGDGTNDPSLTPVDVYGLTSGALGIAAGGYHSCGVLAGGGAKCWGDNYFGQLGDGTNDPSNVPVSVSGL